LKKSNKNPQTKIQSNNSIDKTLYTKKKAFLWLMIFPPYGLYRLFKHRLIHRGLAIGIAVLFLLIVGLSVDIVLNPFRVQNNLALKSFTEFNSAHTDLGLGDIRFVNRIGTKTIGERKYDEYEAITKFGRFEIFFGSENGKEYVVEAIYETLPERELRYTTDGTKDVITDTFPEIVEFLNTEKDKFGEYKSLVEKIDYNIERVETSKGIYEITLKYNQVSEVVQVEGDKTTNVYEKAPEIKLIDNLQGLAEKNVETIGKVQKVLSYELFPSEQTQSVLTDKGEYKLTYHDDGNYDVYRKDDNTTDGSKVNTTDNTKTTESSDKSK
jgi:hypothetical protein